MKAIYELILARKQQGKKSLAVLIDPDKTDRLPELLQYATTSPPDFFFIGGSLLSDGKMESCISQIKKVCPTIPTLLFPGNEMQISGGVNALLLLTVISGRNPELLIGRHVASAGLIRASKLEVIPTGYVLIDSGAPTAVSYMSNTQPIPREKNSIAALTALAGEQLGLKLIYLEAGSGAQQPVPVEMVATVRKTISCPLIVGGGLRSTSAISERLVAGADIIVVGNVLEEAPESLNEFANTVHAL